MYQTNQARRDAIDIIKRTVPITNYLEKNQHGGYICPFCGSGGHGYGSTSAVKVYKETNTAACFSANCDPSPRSFDVIAVYMQNYNKGFNEACNDLIQGTGIDYDFSAHERVSAAEDFRDGGGQEPRHIDNDSVSVPKRQDFTKYLEECRIHINDPAALAYLKKRGISIETAIKCGLGFDPAADPANAPGAIGNEYKPYPTPRIIFPTTTDYEGRRTDGKTDHKSMCPSGSGKGFFYAEALQEKEPVFVCEGLFDALSIIEAGHPAISISSANNAVRFLEFLERNRPAGPLVIVPDNDDAGRKAADQLEVGLKELKIPYFRESPIEGIKDFSDYWNESPEEMKVELKDAAAVAREEALHFIRPDNTKDYVLRLMAGEIERFNQVAKTGFRDLDEKTRGLYAGLYIVAASSSLGKTSWALQVADQIAASGRDVLYFSLEQSRLDLVAKSFSRITAQNDPETATDALSIKRGNLSPAVLNAAEDYMQSIETRMNIIEGDLSTNILTVVIYVRDYIKRTGTKPVVFVDYLQPLKPAPLDDKGNAISIKDYFNPAIPDPVASGRPRNMTDKQIVDENINGLKIMSRDLDITVFVISSLNRANYMQPVSFESLKESGSIEYSADVVFGLNYAVIQDNLFNGEGHIKEKRQKIQEAMNGDARGHRSIWLNNLKNRYGRAGFNCFFDYDPKHDLFREDFAAEFNTTEDDDITFYEHKTENANDIIEDMII